jgi:hypothetical protein
VCAIPPTLFRAVSGFVKLIGTGEDDTFSPSTLQKTGLLPFKEAVARAASLELKSRAD